MEVEFYHFLRPWQLFEHDDVYTLRGLGRLRVAKHVAPCFNVVNVCGKLIQFLTPTEQLYVKRALRRDYTTTGL